VTVNKKPYQWLKSNRNKRFLYLWGGASSSKSHTVGQYLLFEKLYKERNIRILALRKTRPAVKASCWEVVHHWLNKAGLPYTENRSELTITAPNGNRFIFDGLDNVLKKKSMEGINYVWPEELAAVGHDASFTLREFMQLNIICRAHNPNGPNQIFCTFNPVDPVGNEWLKSLVDAANSRADSAAMHITFDDNPFLSEAEANQIRSLAQLDAEYDKIYRQGQWATPRFIIYENWDTVPDWPARYDQRIWGLDFGYSSSPAALVEIRTRSNDVWLAERLYQTGLTNPELIAALETAGVPQNDLIVADPAEPKSIEELRRAGYNVHPADTGPDSVRFGINAVKQFRLHILARSQALLREIRGYKWKQNAAGEPLPEPLKINDHLMDAMRYALAKIVRRQAVGIVFVSSEPASAENMEDYDFALAEAH